MASAAQQGAFHAGERMTGSTHQLTPIAGDQEDIAYAFKDRLQWA
jgi:hypothetical protein